MTPEEPQSTEGQGNGTGRKGNMTDRRGMSGRQGYSASAADVAEGCHSDWGQGPGPQAPLGASTCSFTPRETDCRSFYTARVELKCWLLQQRRTILLKATVPDSFPIVGQTHSTSR